MTTLSSLAPGSSAITLTCGRLSGGSTSTSAVEPACGERRAVGERGADDRDRHGLAPPGSSVPTIRPSRVGVLPWLKMMTASAPAAWALTALTANVHVPRWIRAMSAGPPKSSPAKSAASHPLVDRVARRGEVDVDRDHVAGDRRRTRSR